MQDFKRLDDAKNVIKNDIIEFLESKGFKKNRFHSLIKDDMIVTMGSINIIVRRLDCKGNIFSIDLDGRSTEDIKEEIYIDLCFLSSYFKRSDD